MLSFQSHQTRILSAGLGMAWNRHGLFCSIETLYLHFHMNYELKNLIKTFFVQEQRSQQDRPTVREGQRAHSKAEEGWVLTTHALAFVKHDNFLQLFLMLENGLKFITNVF